LRPPAPRDHTVTAGPTRPQQPPRRSTTCHRVVGAGVCGGEPAACRVPRPLLRPTTLGSPPPAPHDYAVTARPTRPLISPPRNTTCPRVVGAGLAPARPSSSRRGGETDATPHPPPRNTMCPHAMGTKTSRARCRCGRGSRSRRAASSTGAGGRKARPYETGGRRSREHCVAAGEGRGPDVGAWSTGAGGRKARPYETGGREESRTWCRLERRRRSRREGVVNMGIRPG